MFRFVRIPFSCWYSVFVFFQSLHCIWVYECLCVHHVHRPNWHGNMFMNQCLSIWIMIWHMWCDTVKWCNRVVYARNWSDRFALLFFSLKLSHFHPIFKVFVLPPMQERKRTHTHILKLCIARRLMWKCQERDILRIDHTKSKRKAPITTCIELADKRHYDYKRDQVSQQPLQTAFTHSHLALFHQYLIHYSRGKSKTLTKWRGKITHTHTQTKRHRYRAALNGIQYF